MLKQYEPGNALVTVAMSTRNDALGVWWTITNALSSVVGSELEGRIRIAVINNSDDEQQKKDTNYFCSQFGNLIDYKEESFLSNHKGRNEAIRLSKTPYTVLCDAHVSFGANFFKEGLSVLRERPYVGIVHAPFSFNHLEVPYKMICFYNTVHFHKNLHGTYSRGNALWDRPYPCVIAPHAGMMFRTKEWLDFGGYMDICTGHGGGEPFVSYKYWMFGMQTWVTPNTCYIHKRTGGYKKVKSNWKRNFVRTAFALGGEDLGLTYAKRLGVSNTDEQIHLWKESKPYHEFVLSKQVIPFKNLWQHFIDKKARPLSQEDPE